MRECDVAMGELVIPKGEHGALQFRVGIGEVFGLLLVMLVDDVLDRDRAGQSGALTEQRRRDAERIPGNRP